MNRRESLRLLTLGALGARPLLAGEVAAAAMQPRGFASRWQDWPDVRWAGPECWGNRLQDWQVRDGVVVCGARAPDRTLHCLTHRAGAGAYRTTVALDTEGLAGGGPSARVGFRLGVRGRFPDPRSAAVHGAGLDVAVDGGGALAIGDGRSAGSVPVGGPVHLEAAVEDRGPTARIELVARAAPGGPAIARMMRENLAASAVRGNVALLSSLGERTAGGPAAAFADWTIAGPGIVADPAAAFGPIMFAQYTLHRGVLKLTAQLAPLERIRGLTAWLETGSEEGGWSAVDEATIDPLARTARFRVPGWDGGRARPYRVRVRIPLAGGGRDFTYEGTVAAEPAPKVAVKAAVFSCNADHGFPDSEVVRHVAEHAPDLALFLGDQFYEGSGGFGIQTDSVAEAALDMLHKWYMFGWSYREIFRHVPAAFIPDDHDVYHGNVWGEGGKVAPTDQGWGAVAQDQGGYKMPAVWVNAVQRAQTSHLPDPYDPTPVEQGIGVYYTQWDYGGVSFAIVEDRKFKSAPKNVLPPEADVVNGWVRNPDFDVRGHRDLPEAELLGERQMTFLDVWAADWAGPTFMKVALSQTNFAAVHTIPEDATSGAVLPSLPVPQPGRYVEGDKLAVDLDSNGWPASRRDEVLRVLRRCAAFHIAGDQHLATVVRHGVEAFGDAAFSFTGPALNNIWPRRWWPPRALREAPLPAGGPAYTGDFRDGFGNRITVYAAASPRATGLEPSIIRDRATGYGIVTFDKVGGRIAIECWPRHVAPTSPGAAQYEGWPITVAREDGDGRRPLGHLPQVRVRGAEDPVVEVRSAAGAIVYSRRIVGTSFTPPVFERATHVVRVGIPERGLWREREVAPERWGRGVLDFDLSG